MFDNKSDFEKMLETANAARNEKVDLNEYVESVSNMLNIGIHAVIEKNQKNIMAVDEKLRAKIKENVKKALEEALNEIEDYPKKTEL